MTAKIDLFAAAPSLMKDWQRTSMQLGAAASFEPKLDRAREDSRLPDQRLRQLHQSACD